MNSLKGPYLTRRKLVKILRWLRNKEFKIKVIYEYNNSVGGHESRKHSGIIRKFSVKDEEGLYKVNICFDDGYEMCEWLNSDYEFYYKFHPKHLELTYNNSGPYCYFIIDILDYEISKEHK